MSDQANDFPAGFLDCPVCSQIAALETSFSKYGWPEHDSDMSPAVHQLVAAEELTARNENHHIQVCSHCGTYYRYDFSYEYLVNGSEDTATLLRLAYADARHLMSDEAYARSMLQVSRFLQHADARLQGFGGACLVAHHLHQADLPAFGNFITGARIEAARGALVYLLNLIDRYADLTALRETPGLQQTLARIIAFFRAYPESDPRCEIGKLAGYLQANLFPA